jgi:hypothetical protein
LSFTNLKIIDPNENNPNIKNGGSGRNGFTLLNRKLIKELNQLNEAY